MNQSRKRLQDALSHRQPDRIPLDLGGTAVTGMSVSAVYALRQALELDPPGTPVKVVEPFQMLGEIGEDLKQRLGVDIEGISGTRTLFGFPNTGWKAWTTFDGTPVLVPEGFNTDPEPDGSICLYPEGDKTASPSGRMPRGGWYFDAICRQAPIDDDALSVADNTCEFSPITDEELTWYSQEAERARATGRGVIASFGGTSFGDIALVPAMWMKQTPGIRDVEEWYASTVIRRDYVYAVFERQCAIALQNLERLQRAVGDAVDAVFVTGTDFGTQNGLFISRRAYRDLFMPFHIEVNQWVHRHTSWKTLIHSCGAVADLIPDFIEAGFDILNPAQTTAAGMDAQSLKQRYGDQITFWGGGIDTQKTLPFGTPAQIADEVRRRIEVFGANGGFVFNTVHNVQAGTPAANLIALYDTVNAFR